MAEVAQLRGLGLHKQQAERAAHGGLDGALEAAANTVTGEAAKGRRVAFVCGPRCRDAPPGQCHQLQTACGRTGTE